MMSFFEWAMLGTSAGTLITVLLLLKKQTVTVPSTLRAVATEMLTRAIAEKSVSAEAAANPTEYLQWCREVQESYLRFLETIEGVEIHQ